MLVIAMSAYDKNIGDYCRETFRDKNSWLMQDPYEYSDPSDRICFILYGDRKTPDKGNVNIRRIAERVTRKTKPGVMTMNMSLTYWVKLRAPGHLLT